MDKLPLVGQANFATRRGGAPSARLLTENCEAAHGWGERAAGSGVFTTPCGGQSGEFGSPQVCASVDNYLLEVMWQIGQRRGRTL